MNWSGKRVLVTGAGGFIGSHLTEKLVQLGANTRALVHYNALGLSGWLDHSEVRREVEIVAGDVCDREMVREAMRGVDIVFHLAALIGIPYSYRSPASYVRTNIEGTLTVLQTARDLGVERLVHTSTSEVYGSAQYVPIDERHPLQAQSPYAASKIGADQLAESYHRSFGVPVVTVRPFNTFGPRQSARAIIPVIIGQCLAGETVRIGNLHPTRDLNFVANTAEGFVMAAAASVQVGGTFNLGSGREISIEALAHLIARMMGRTITIRSEQERLRPERSEVDRLLADTKRAQALLGWQPKVTLEDGLAVTIDWMRANRHQPEAGAYAI